MTAKNQTETITGVLPASMKWSCVCCRETVDALSCELSIEIYRLEKLREKLCPELMNRSKNTRVIRFRLNLTSQCAVSAN